MQSRQWATPLNSNQADNTVRAGVKILLPKRNKNPSIDLEHKSRIFCHHHNNRRNCGSKMEIATYSHLAPSHPNPTQLNHRLHYTRSSAPQPPNPTPPLAAITHSPPSSSSLSSPLSLSVSLTHTHLLSLTFITTLTLERPAHHVLLHATSKTTRQATKSRS